MGAWASVVARAFARRAGGVLHTQHKDANAQEEGHRYLYAPSFECLRTWLHGEGLVQECDTNTEVGHGDDGGGGDVSGDVSCVAV